MGDLHGAHKALVQCLERSGFDKQNDELISLGDIADGWDEVYECVEELLSIKNLIHIKGNHDDTFNVFLETNRNPFGWSQGGVATVKSYARHCNHEILTEPSYTDINNNQCYRTSLNTGDIPELHKKFFRTQILYYLDDNNNLFIHAGFNRHFTLSENRRDDVTRFYWDRNLWEQAMSCAGSAKLKTQENFNEIFIGHTATVCWTENKQIIRNGDDKIIKSYSTPIMTPMHRGGVWNMDTGAGWMGKLTILNIDTKEYYQSDNVQDLYKDQIGR